MACDLDNCQREETGAEYPFSKRQECRRLNKNGASPATIVKGKGDEPGDQAYRSNGRRTIVVQHQVRLPRTFQASGRSTGCVFY